MVKTLEEAIVQLQHLHSLVERMAMAVKAQQPTQIFGAQFRRAAGPLVGLLKGQFGLIADQVVGMTLIATRGGSEKTKLSALREGVGSVRTQLEITMNKVYEKHAAASEQAEPNTA